MAQRILSRKRLPMAFSSVFRYNSVRTASSSFCELIKNRKVVSIQRESCSDFLQGLVTNDMNLFQSNKCIYTMLLNSKGRVLYDGFLYSTECPDRFLVESSTEAADPLVKHLKMYTLRKKIEVSESELLPWAVFGKSVSHDRLVADPRCREPWVYRCLSESQPCTTVEDGNYSKLRYSLGIAEGSSEIPVGEAFPLEYNADFLNGVSFEKGCYVGQELTARVHHTGVIRKRIMPLELDEEPPQGWKLDDPVVDSESGKTIGKIRGVHRNRALALMRINETLSSKGLVWGGLNVRATIPSWWPPLQKETAKRI